MIKKLILVMILFLVMTTRVSAGSLTTTDGQTITFTNADYIQKRLNRGTLAPIQNHIDQGFVALAVNPFSVSDNQTTHFMGHYPGVFFIFNHLENR